jgi:protein TonB
MFDMLVESSKHGKENAKTGSFMLVTGLIYAIALIAVLVWTIMRANFNLVDALDVSTLLAPPPPPAAPPPPAPAAPIKVIPTVTTFTPPSKPPERIPDPKTIVSQPVVQVSRGVPGGVPGGQVGGVPGGTAARDDAPPPPPPPPPTPKPTPEATPVPKQIKVSGGVLQGSAIRKVQPQYPPIAKAAHASGAVQVQVTISEEGRVIDDAALQAAKQWAFKPTELSGVPVKVQGILTFNFTLQ